MKQELSLTTDSFTNIIQISLEFPTSPNDNMPFFQGPLAAIKVKTTIRRILALVLHCADSRTLLSLPVLLR